MNDFAAVRDLLAAYFDMLYYCDLDRFDAVFHPQALYATADETPFLYRDMPTYREVIARRSAPASRGEQRRDVIDAIEFAGDNTALARVRCAIGDRDFVDLLSLVRVEGRWRIIAKVFHIVDHQGARNALR